MDLKKAGLPHDIILTDDNICVPFCIRYPDKDERAQELANKLATEDGKIHQEFCHTRIYDLIAEFADSDRYSASDKPTVISEILWPSEDIPVGLMRFLFQVNRLTAIRTAESKVVFNRGDNTAFAFDLVKDPYENDPLEDLSSSQIKC